MESYEYKNRAKIDVTACGETHTIYSNEVNAEKVVVRVEKLQNKCCVFEGDQLEYTIKIFNDSNIVIDNVIFCDDIPEGLEYAANTFNVDGKPETPAREPYSNSLTFTLNTLMPHSVTLITFKTIVK